MKNSIFAGLHNTVHLEEATFMYAKFTGVQQATDQSIHRYCIDQLVQCSAFNRPSL